MTSLNTRFTILVAEDDPDDRLLLNAAFLQSKPHRTFVTQTADTQLVFVDNGQELVDYLNMRGRYINKENFPWPNLVLIDLNMPIKDGREAIAEIKQNPLLRSLPLVVLTTSQEDEDIVKSYELGVSSFIPKPTQFESLVHTVRILQEYWCGMCRLAPHRQSGYEQG